LEELVELSSEGEPRPPHPDVLLEAQVLYLPKVIIKGTIPHNCFLVLSSLLTQYFTFFGLLQSFSIIDNTVAEVFMLFKYKVKNNNTINNEPP
jgi:hypothetical protein